jgi:hypothetical protein
VETDDDVLIRTDGDKVEGWVNQDALIFPAINQNRDIRAIRAKK